LSTVLQNLCFDDYRLDEICVNAEEETASKPLTIVPSNISKGFHSFYSQGEVKRFLNDFVFPHMTLCTLFTNFVLQESEHKNATIEVSCSS
jgi:hypothetical protein